MQLGRLLRQWLPPILLAAVALGAWRAANEADFELGSRVEENYELTVGTDMLSARRIPYTLQAPVNAALIAAPIEQFNQDTPSQQMCLAVRNGDEILGTPRTVAGGLVPASNEKLLTTFAALEVLGPDFRFVTRTMSTADVIDGVLDGDLYLVGDGDPFLITDNWISQYEIIEGRHHTRLEVLADRVVAAGITRIAGAVVGDESLYDQERYGPWDGRLINQKQSGPLSALTVNEGFVDWPAVYPDSARSRSETADPAAHGASVLAGLLAERGVSIGSGSRAGLTPGTAVEVAAVESPPLSDVITHINTYSSNLGAELLLKRVGLVAGGAGTTEAGAAAMTRILTDRGVPMTGVQLFDGSGLAETNRLTCAAIAGVLVAAGPDTAFGRSLAVAGERGSLLERFDRAPLDGNVLAKTGTLRGVRALSGYVENTDPEATGGYITFAYVINDDEVLDDELLNRLQRPLLTALRYYPAGPDVEDLSPLDAEPR